jgi:hypothetical protein
MLSVPPAEGSSSGMGRHGIAGSVNIISNEVLKEVIERQIDRLENSIREAAKTAKFADPVFSEWYCIQANDISRLKKELSKL